MENWQANQWSAMLQYKAIIGFVSQFLNPGQNNLTWKISALYPDARRQAHGTIVQQTAHCSPLTAHYHLTSPSLMG
jgi:hypothetical protein